MTISDLNIIYFTKIVTMKVNFVTKLELSVTKKDQSHPLYTQITFNGTSRKKRIKGYSCKKDHWDFDRHQYNAFEKGREKKNDYINAYLEKCIRVYENNFFNDFNYRTFVQLLEEVDKPKEKKLEIRLFEFCKSFADEKQADGKISSADNYYNLIPLLKKVFKKDMRIRDFDLSCIKKLVKYFDQKKIKGYNYLKFLSILYNQAIKRSHVEAKYCPFKGVFNPNGYNFRKRKNKPSVRVNKKRILDLTEAEKDMVVKYYEQCTVSPLEKKYLAYWMLSYRFFGVNFKDLALLKWSDINNRYWKYSRSKTGFQNKLGKPVVVEALEILREYDSGGKYILDILNGYDNDPMKMEKRLKSYKDNCRKCYLRVSKKIGFSDNRYFTFYSVRYTAPTLALTKGADINTVKTLMDHASINTTNKYLGMVRDRKKLEI